MTPWPLVAMENTLFAEPCRDWAGRCAEIADAGFDGIYAVLHPLTDEELARAATLSVAPSRQGLRLAGLYANLDLAQPADSLAGRRLIRLFETVSGVPRIELSFKRSEPLSAPPGSLDEMILARLDPLLAIAERRGFVIGLYPHSFYPLETLAAAASLVRRVAHPRLGYVFPTSHVYALGSADLVLEQLRAHAANVASFNVCGCRRPAAPPAKCSHAPLDEGDFDLAPLFTTLAAAGYRGDVIVQGHGWQGDLPAMLRRCVTVYRRLVAS